MTWNGASTRTCKHTFRNKYFPPISIEDIEPDDVSLKPWRQGQLLQLSTPSRWRSTCLPSSLIKVHWILMQNSILYFRLLEKAKTGGNFQKSEIDDNAILRIGVWSVGGIPLVTVIRNTLEMFCPWCSSMMILIMVREVVKKKRSFYGQADCKGLSPPPPYGQGVVIFSK